MGGDGGVNYGNVFHHICLRHYAIQKQSLGEQISRLK